MTVVWGKTKVETVMELLCVWLVWISKTWNFSRFFHIKTISTYTIRKITLIMKELTCLFYPYSFRSKVKSNLAGRVNFAIVESCIIVFIRNRIYKTAWTKKRFSILHNKTYNNLSVSNKLTLITPWDSLLPFGLLKCVL